MELPIPVGPHDEEQVYVLEEGPGVRQAHQPLTEGLTAREPVPQEPGGFFVLGLGEFRRATRDPTPRLGNIGPSYAGGGSPPRPPAGTPPWGPALLLEPRPAFRPTPPQTPPEPPFTPRARPRCRAGLNEGPCHRRGPLRLGRGRPGAEGAPGPVVAVAGGGRRRRPLRGPTGTGKEEDLLGGRREPTAWP